MAWERQKKKEQTLEERLEQALVPVKEQPYEVPENWCWTQVENVSSLYRGVSFKKDDVHSKKKENDILIIRGGNVGEGCIDTELDKIYVSGNLVQEHQLIRKNDIIIVASTGSKTVIGRSGISKEDYNDVAFGAFLMLIRPNRRINSAYVGYYFQSNLYRNRIQSLANGVNINNIRADHILKAVIPLPPLAEQQRIVDRIESLFAKLDEAKEKAQAVVDGFEARKAAILYKAFNGELSSNWRNANGISDITWHRKTLQDVCSMKITDGTHKTPVYCEPEQGVPFLSAKDVTSGSICWDNIKYIIPELHEELYSRLAPRMDDILLAKNGTTGMAALVDVEDIFDIYVTLAILRPDKDIILPKYLLRIINSPICKKQFDEHLTGIGVPNLHLRDIKNVQIVVPSLEEQAEIVLLLDSLLIKEQQVKETAEAVLDQIEAMKKSILAHAFRGELGTNDSTEESAVELLKQVL